MARKILVLHGYSQNAYIFKKKLIAIQRACGNELEFVFIDAPHTLTPEELVGSKVTFGHSTGGTNDPALTPLAWWRQKDETDRSRALGIEASLDHLKSTLSNDKYEAILGFSQGATLAGIVAAILERPETYIGFLDDGKPIHPPFEHCLFFSGYRTQDPIAEPIFQDYKIKAKTLHVFGRSDTVVEEALSRELVDACHEPRVEIHGGDHILPTTTPWRNFLRDYLKDPNTLSSPS